jgi:DNA-binding FadR family transcriptional regulator
MPDNANRRPAFNAQDEIKRIILDRGLTPGAPVPTETDLVVELGISRGSVREALKGLQARGIVSIEHGRGTFVGRPSMDPLVDSLAFLGRLSTQGRDLTTAAELFEVRDILETALVQKVAVIADDALLATLEDSVLHMEELARTGQPFHREDRRFHEELYAPLGRHLVTQLVRAFWDVLDAVRPELPDTTSDAAADADHHRVILQCIRDRDPGAAAIAMREHFLANNLWAQANLRRGSPPVD